MKVLFHYETDPQLEAALNARNVHGYEIVCCPQDDETKFEYEIQTADVLWHVLKPVTAAHIKSAPRLKLIQKIGVGVNTIDVAAAERAGVAVCNMPGTNTQAVAEMTLLLMLAALRLQPRLDALTRTGAWRQDEATRGALGEISGRTIGFVGFGGVPRRLAPVLEALGADLVYWSRTQYDVPYTYLDLGALLERSDIVSLHVPLTSETEGMMSHERLSAMKAGSVLVNTARGGLIDEAALIDVLKSGHLRAAGLDVFAVEPTPAANPLLALDQVVVSPHAAWLTAETLQRSLDAAFQNTAAISSGSPLLHRVK